jgi:type IV pilus assembly protein PilY1
LDDGVGQWHDAAVVAGPESGSVTITYDAASRDLAVGDYVGNITDVDYEKALADKTNFNAVWGRITSITFADPYPVVPELAESWSEPQFGVVKTSDVDTTGTAVLFIGGGYSPDNSDGKAVVAVNLFTGAVVKKFTAINFSVPGTVRIIDEDNNGFVDKIYVGDLGGQMWRIGKFTDAADNPLSFPASNEDINTWTEQVLFSAPTYVVDSITYTRKFFYPPNVTFEKEFDMVFMGTGNREDACNTTTGADRIYAVKDTHVSTTLTETSLVDVTDTADTPPNLSAATGDVDSNGEYDQGWYIRLVDGSGSAAGEKVLGQGRVFYKTFYITTFVPNNDPCVPGGDGFIYGLNYLTGEAVLTFGNDADGDGVEDLTRRLSIGGGIPSKPVLVLTRGGQKLLVSVGTTKANLLSESIGAGVISVDPLAPTRNFFYIWWMELFS